jgi:hypothetical protein
VTIYTDTTLQGSLVLFLPTQWQSPTKEAFTGIVEYTPSSNSASNVIPPDSMTVISAAAQSFSADGVHVLAIQNATSSQLVSFNRLSQSVDSVIKTLSENGRFTSFVWSPDGSRVAYLAIDPGKASGLGVSGASVADDLGNGTPLMFSPDSAQLLVIDKNELEMIDLASGSRTSVSDAFSPNGFTIIPSLSGHYLLAVPAGENQTATIVRVDWKARSFEKVGYLQTDSGSILFTPEDKLLQIKENGIGYEYQVTDDGLKSSGAYILKLPNGSKALYWKKS